MCGRFVVATAPEDLADLFHVHTIGDDLPRPSLNVAPTDRVPIVLDARPKGENSAEPPVRRLESARWGLVPGWAGDVKIGITAFNARIESAADKPHFRSAVAKRRAILPATGYYEWRTLDGTKVPYFIHLPGGELTLFAGLYEWWRDPARADDDPQRWLLSASVLTRESGGALNDIHDRMPVFLHPDLIDEWLDPAERGGRQLLEEISARGAEQAQRMQFHEVDRSVGNVRNNSPLLTQPLTSTPGSQ